MLQAIYGRSETSAEFSRRRGRKRGSKNRVRRNLLLLGGGLGLGAIYGASIGSKRGKVVAEKQNAELIKPRMEKLKSAYTAMKSSGLEPEKIDLNLRIAKRYIVTDAVKNVERNVSKGLRIGAGVGAIYGGLAAGSIIQNIKGIEKANRRIERRRKRRLSIGRIK